ncbi:NB-ARC domain-containing protein [Actinophytocola sediminis]
MVVRLSSFGSLLLRYRRSAGLSQGALARASGMSVRALRELEHGRAQSAQHRSAEVLADALGLAGGERDLFLAVAKQGRRRSSPADPAALCALPAAVVDMRGRAGELAWLRSEAEGTVVVVGPPGVGKTALAVSAAHASAERFPDGALAVELRGADGEPVAAGVAVDRLLRALGVPAGRIPAAKDEQANLLKALVAPKRMLVLLDDATDEAQVRPLLATGPAGLTLITCRQALAGLDAVHRVWLEPLGEPDARGLLVGIVGADRVAAEPAAAAELIELCGQLPLAVRIVGNRLATRPHWRLAYMAEQLRDERARLASLSAGDLALRPSFEVSYRRLSPAARIVFRRLTVIPGTEFGAELAAVAIGDPLSGVAVHLEELADASLLAPTPVSGRFQFNDLLRIFAGERLAAEETPETGRQCRDAVLTHLLERATAAARLFLTDAPADEQGLFPSRSAAEDWLVREKPNWTAAQRVAAALGWHREVVDLAHAMHWLSDNRIPEQPWDEIYRLGLAAARALGDAVDEATLLNQLGWAHYMCLGDVEAARARHSEALAIARRVGDRRELAVAHGALSLALMRLGKVEQGLAHGRQADELAAELGFSALRLSMRNVRGIALRATCDLAAALSVFRGVLAELDGRGDQPIPVRRWLRAMVLDEIGGCLAGLGQWRPAAESHVEARLTFALLGAAYREARSALLEGVAWRSAGRHARARDCLEFALGFFVGPHYQADRERVLAELGSVAG